MNKICDLCDNKIKLNEDWTVRLQSSDTVWEVIVCKECSTLLNTIVNKMEDDHEKSEDYYDEQN